MAGTAVSLHGSGLGSPLMGSWGIIAPEAGRAHPEIQDGGSHGFPGSRNLGFSLGLLQLLI